MMMVLFIYGVILASDVDRDVYKTPASWTEFENAVFMNSLFG